MSLLYPPPPHILSHVSPSSSATEPPSPHASATQPATEPPYVSATHPRDEHLYEYEPSRKTNKQKQVKAKHKYTHLPPEKKTHAASASTSAATASHPTAARTPLHPPNVLRWNGVAPCVTSPCRCLAVP